MSTAVVKSHNKVIGIGKGLCIILMVIGHSGCPQLLRDWLYTFHMPFFFFVSGYLFSDKSLNSFFSFVKKKMRGLWWPFLKWNVVFIILHNLFYELHFLYDCYSLKEIVRRILCSVLMVEYEYLLNPFWFLQQLIRVNIIAWVMIKICNYLSLSLSVPRKFLILGANVIIAVFAVVACGTNFKVPGVLSKLTIICLLCYFSGYTYCQFESVICKVVTSRTFLLLAFVTTLVGAVYNPAELSTVSVKGTLPYWIVGVLGCLMVLEFSRRLSLMKIGCCMDYIGEHTLSIMVWHFLMFKFLSLLLVQLNVVSYESLLTWPVPAIAKEGWWILYSLIGVVVPLIIYVVLRKINGCFVHYFAILHTKQ